MNVSSASIRNPIPAVLLFIMLTIVGLMSFRAMKIQQFPDVELPNVIVSAALPGAAPAQMETEVARRIENSIASIQGLKHQYTIVQDGVATITAEFRLEKPIQEALDEVRDAVQRVRSDLPADLRDPVITKLDMAAMPILAYTVASPRLDDEALSWFIDNQVTKALLAVRGVGGVSRVGGATREVRVELDPARLQALGATAADVSRRLRQVQQEASGGRTDVGGAEQSVRTIATVASAQDLAALEIAWPAAGGERRVRLDQIARVSDTVGERRAAALLDGKPVVAFEVARARGAGEVDVQDGVRAALAKLREQHPDVAVTEAFNFVEPVVENYEGSMALLIEGALLAVVVVWAFLRNWRATLISAVALPLSIIPTFFAMHLMGFTINVVTLLSLSLVVGILVDDAIVEIENIMRHLSAGAGPPQAGRTPSGGATSEARSWRPTFTGKSPYQAAMEAADEIGLAVIATTFTLIAVFLPTAFMSGVPGRFFVQFGWTAAIAVWFSLVVARMLTPMMAAYLLKPLARAPREPAWMRWYLRLAAWCLRHRVKTLLATVLFTVGACTPLVTGRIASGFIPPDDLSQTQVNITLPPGSTFDETLAAAEHARAIVQRVPHVTRVYTAIGGGRAGGDPFISQMAAADPRKATLTINLTPRDERRGVSKQAIEGEMRHALEQVPGARVKVGFGGSSEKFILVLAGEDGEQLAAHARRVEHELRTLPGIGAVTSTSSLQRPELVVRPDPARAADLGVTAAAIADTLRIATTGDYDQSLAKLNLAQRQVPVVVRLPDSARQDLALIERLGVPGSRGTVPLGNVATLAIGSGPAQIDRYDRLRNINFEIELNGVPLGTVQQLSDALPSLANLPAGIVKTTVGDAEAMGELAESFVLAMLTGVACIYIVLVLLFHAFVQPLTILVALVLSIPGAILALFVAGTDLSMPSMIGMIMLMGIATKNSILLVDYVVMARRDHGLNRWDALLDACSKRARPIVMTTIAMGAGMLPIAIGFGTDPSFRAPMAIVVIGGLITSTFLSLLVIPVVFTYVDDFVTRLRGLRRHPAVPAGGAALPGPADRT
ncbi:MAG: efflux RND transporter permease subunit [Ideonella sp.]|nr:efflux RND transporter permease subunit [Ideonella sp.]